MAFSLLQIVQFTTVPLKLLSGELCETNLLFLNFKSFLFLLIALYFPTVEMRIAQVTIIEKPQLKIISLKNHSCLIIT